MMALSDRPSKPIDAVLRRRLLGAGAALGVAGCGGCAQTGAGTPGRGRIGSGEGAAGAYAAAMRQTLVAVAGELPGYQFRHTPVGNFGVGSIYLQELVDGDLSRVEGNWFLGGPDSWLAPRLGALERRRWHDRLISEGSMGAVDFSTANARHLHLQAGVALLRALTGSAGLDAQRSTATRLRAADVRQRRLNWAGFQAALQAGQVAPEVASLVRSGRFVIAAADIVLAGYSAEITVDNSSNPALSVALRAHAGVPLGPGGQAAWRIDEAARGHFTVTAPGAVVAAVLLKRPPPAAKDLAGAAAVRSLDEWPSAAVDVGRVSAVESAVLNRALAR